MLRQKLSFNKRLSGPESWVLKSEETQNAIKTEATGAYEMQMIVTLLEMGFRSGQVHRFVEHLKPRTIEEALEQMVKGEAGWEHKFKEGDLSSDLCEVCLEPLDEHLEYNVLDEQEKQEILRRESGFTVNPHRFKDSLLIVKKKLREESKAEESYFDSQYEDELDQDYNGPVVFCPICCVEYREQRMFSLGCMHQFCRKCVYMYLENKIESAEVAELPCPAGNCSKLFSEAILKKYLSRTVFHKYLRFRQNYVVNIDKNLRWCPSPDCGRFVKGSERKAKAKCVCGFQFCFRCGQPWHPRRKCRDMLDHKYANYVRSNNVKKCPRCRIAVEKVSGCNEMECWQVSSQYRYCYYKFCWRCQEQLTNYHFDGCNFIFGCHNLQCKTFADYLVVDELICLKIFVSMLLLLFMPVALFLNIFIMWLHSYFETYDFRESKVYKCCFKCGNAMQNQSCCCQTFVATFFILFALLFSPFAMLVMLLPAYYVTLRRCCKDLRQGCCRRKKKVGALSSSLRTSEF